MNVKTCAGANLSGATVTVKQGSTTIGTCTSDASGNCCIDVTATGAGSYLVEATKSGYSTYSQNVTLASCNGTTNVSALISNASSTGCEFTINGCGIGCVGASVSINGGTYNTVPPSNKVVVNLPAGSYPYTISAPRHNSATGTATITTPCGFTTATATLTVATGYECLEPSTNGPFPAPDTLFLTTTAGTFTLTYSSAFSAGWYGCGTKSMPNVVNSASCSPCATGTASVAFQIFAADVGLSTFQINVTWYQFTGSCPTFGAYNTATTMSTCNPFAVTGGCVGSAVTVNSQMAEGCQPLAGSGTFAGTLNPLLGAWSLSE